MKPATWPEVPNWIRSCTSLAYFAPSDPNIPLYGSGFMAWWTPLCYKVDALVYISVLLTRLFILRGKRKRKNLNDVEFPVRLSSGSHSCRCVSMVRVPKRNDVVTSRVQPSHHHCQLIRLRTGIREKHHLTHTRRGICALSSFCLARQVIDQPQ